MSIAANDRALPLVGFVLPILAGGNVFFFLDAEPALSMFTAIAIGFTLLWTLGRPVSAQTPSAVLLSLFAFATIWVLQYGFRPSGPSAPTTTRGIVLAAMLFAVLRRRRLAEKELDGFVAAIILGTLVTVGYGQYQYWIAFPRIEPIIRASGLTPILSVNASFYNANCYAAFLAAVAVLGTSLLSRRTATSLRILAAASLVPILGTLVLTGSRATLALLAAAAVVLTILQRIRGPLRLNAAHWIGLACVGAALALILRFSELVQVGLFGRLRFWTASLFMIADHWLLGVGVGLFGEAFPVYRLDSYYTRYPHNFWLEVCAELGVVAAAALTAFLILAFRATMLSSGLGDDGTDDLGGRRRMVVGAALLLLAHAAIDIDWHAPANPVLLFLLLAIAGAASSRRPERANG